MNRNRPDVVRFSLSREVQDIIRAIAYSKGMYQSEVVELAVLRLADRPEPRGRPRSA